MVTGVPELEEVVGHGRGLCSPSLVDDILMLLLHWVGVLLFRIG